MQLLNKPISYLKAHELQFVKHLSENHKIIPIAYNGKADVVFQDVKLDGR